MMNLFFTGPFPSLLHGIADRFYCFEISIAAICNNLGYCFLFFLNYSNAPKMTMICCMGHFVAIFLVHKIVKMKLCLKEQVSFVNLQRKSSHFLKLQVVVLI